MALREISQEEQIAEFLAKRFYELWGTEMSLKNIEAMDLHIPANVFDTYNWDKLSIMEKNFFRFVARIVLKMEESKTII